MKYYYALSSILVGASIVLVQPQVTNALSSNKVTKIGTEITVRVVSDSNNLYAGTGSGVIVKRSGNTYTVLTAAHVVQENKTYQIFTKDQQSYSTTNIKRLPGIDLAIAEFKSSKDYTVAKIGNSDKATYTTTTYVAGFPARNSTSNDSPELKILKGQITANGTGQRDGYNLSYDQRTSRGMSGGPVLNEQGELIGVHGKLESEASDSNPQQVVIVGAKGIPIYLALRSMLDVGVDVGVRLPNMVVATAPSSDDFYIKANDQYKQKDYKGAIASYTEAIRLNSNYAEAYLNRGNVRKELGDKQAAITDYSSALKINPNYADAYHNRGVVRADLGDKQAAISDLEKANELLKLQAAPALSLQKVEQIGKQITVKIVDSKNNSNAGSGVMIKRAGNTYTFITAYHVVQSKVNLQVILPDKQSYLINSNNIKQLPNLDLATVEFSSNNTYKIAQIGNSDQTIAGTTIYITGFPARTAAITNPNEYFFNKEQVTAVSAKGFEQRDGYNIIYGGIPTVEGMSGGAILN